MNIQSIFTYIRQVFSYFAPPRQWRLQVGFVFAVLIGLLVLIFHISNASSYLSDKPETCVNCHIMNPQYATWQRGSHARVATCNDCHVPHDNIFRKYFFKAKDGSRHAFMFTFHMEPQVIRVHEDGAKVIQENCIRCHTNMFTGIAKSVPPYTPEEINITRLHETGRECWQCHRETPHGKVNSLSSVPYARVPQLESPLPEWIEDFLKQRSSEQQQDQQQQKDLPDKKM